MAANPNAFQVPFNHGEVVWGSQDTTNSYVDLAASVVAWDVRGLRQKTVYVKNTGTTNAADVKVLESTDNGATWFSRTQLIQTALGHGDAVVFDCTDSATHIKVQAKSSEDDAETTVYAAGCATQG